VFAELSWVPAELSQCEDRLHRIGTTDSVLVQHLVLEGSLDAMMVHVLFKKQKILDAVLEEEATIEAA
jgi:SWI/SNF-related matrix-associated actin-dependent regulator 1 of chromatin subfamily A